MSTNSQPVPFASNADFLDNVVAWLRLVFARKAAECDLRHEEWVAKLGSDRPRRAGGGVREARGMAYELASQERQVKEQLEQRLTAHEIDPDAPPLGYLKLLEKLRLTEEEGTLLLCLAIPGISPELASETLNDRGFCNSVSAAELLSVLSLTTVEDWWSARSYLRPSSKLVRHGLVVVEPYRGEPTGTTLMSATVEITLAGLSAIMGDPAVQTEAEFVVGE